MSKPFWCSITALRAKFRFDVIFRPSREMELVARDELCHRFDLDQGGFSYYLDAVIVRIPEVIAGAAENARIGVRHIAADA